MANYSITVPFPNLPTKFRRLASMTSTVAYAASKKAAPKLRKEVQTATKNAPPSDPKGLNTGGAIDTTAYLNAWTADALNLGSRVGVLVYNGKHYAQYIEHGRRAGQKRPPAAVILQWAQRKLNLPYEEAKKASFAIARAISNRGLRPRLVLTGPDTEKQFRKIFTFQAEAALSAVIAKWAV